MPESTVNAQRLLPEQLTRTFNEYFDFSSTDELEPLTGVLGQTRAVQALQFGIAMQRTGYNVFVMGESGTGRFSYAKRYLTEQAKLRPAPADWLYVNNFTEFREPQALQLPPGEGSLAEHADGSRPACCLPSAPHGKGPARFVRGAGPLPLRI